MCENVGLRSAHGTAITAEQEPAMQETEIDRVVMGRLAKALAAPRAGTACECPTLTEAMPHDRLVGALVLEDEIV